MKNVLFCLLLICVCMAKDPEFMTLEASSPSFSVKSLIQNYPWEFCGVLFILAYASYFYVGRRKNVRIVMEWLNQYRILLESQFTSVGISANYGLFMRESFDQFRLFCSGRKNCKGMLIDLKLKKRQDLFSLLLDFITPVDDIMTVDIPMDKETLTPFLFALCPKRDYRSVHSENADLKDMGKQIAIQFTPELSKVSGNWVVISDNTEVASTLLSSSILPVLRVSNSLLRLIHISDHMPAPTDNRVLLSSSGIRIKAQLPAYDRMNALGEIMKMIVTIIDTASSITLSTKASNDVKKIRNVYMEKQMREEHEMRQERMKAKKEEKMKEEKERIKKLSPEMQEKYAKKLEKEEKKKKMKNRVKVVKA